MSEFEIIDLIRRTIGPPDHGVRVGIGDDAAVCESPRTPLLFCNDALVENSHFRLDWISPEELGHKALATVLSDIAAMNGRALYALVSLALRPGLGADFVEPFYRGLAALAKQHGVSIVGGDLTRSTSELFIDISLVGASDRAVTRAGARPGNKLAVTGCIGASRAALFALQSGVPRSQLDAALTRAHFQPSPRFDAIAALDAPGLVTAMIDISDGLASELHHLARASQCGFFVDEARLPLQPAAVELARHYGQDAAAWAWSGGEDYELLLTLDAAVWETVCASHPETERWVTVIGEARAANDGIAKRRAADGKIVSVPDAGWTFSVK